MKKVYHKIPRQLPLPNSVPKKRLNPVVHLLLSIWFWAGALFLSVPGLVFHLYSSFLGARRLMGSPLDRKIIGALILFPMDTVRYFEFDFLWKSLSRGKTLGDYLDVSSPRLFSVRVLNTYCFEKAVLINPVASDLLLTERLLKSCGLNKRCEFRNCLIENLDDAPASFDTIVSISVIEHIPGEGDREAVKRIWELLRPGGRLLLSVPCAKEAFEEYLDFNEYELLTADDENFVFGQRFYDQGLLEERIFSITGSPVRSAVYGEKTRGSFKKNREDKSVS